MEFVQSFILIITAVIDPIIMFILVYAMYTSEYLQSRPWGHRLGVGLCAVGMFGQAYWSWHYMITDLPPDYLNMPLWIGKDMGIWIVTLYFFFNVLVQNNKSNG